MDSDTPKKWVSRKNAPPEPSLKSGKVAPAVNREDIIKVVDSFLFANAQLWKADLEDPMTTWPTVLTSKEFDPVLKSKVMDQILDTSGSPGKRFDLIKKNQTPPHLNKWIRSCWIIQNWISTTEPASEEVIIDGTGLSYLTDETAALWIEIYFPELGDFSVKQFRDFREKYNLIQVPPQYRISGVFKNGAFKANRIGKKRI